MHTPLRNNHYELKWSPSQKVEPRSLMYKIKQIIPLIVCIKQFIFYQTQLKEKREGEREEVDCYSETSQ